MDYFVGFAGFSITPGFVYDGHFKQSPIETACGILERYRGVTLEAGLETVREGKISSNVYVPSEGPIERLFDGIDPMCDWLYLEMPGKEVYIIQRLVVGDLSISQVEKRKSCA